MAWWQEHEVPTDGQLFDIMRTHSAQRNSVKQSSGARCCLAFVFNAIALSMASVLIIVLARKAKRENAQCDSVGMQLVARFIRGVHHHAGAGRARVRQPSTWVARKTQVTQCNTPGPFVQIIVVVPRDLAIVESPPICASRGVVVGGVPTVQKGSHVLFEEGARCGPVEVLGCALRHACILRQCCASDMHGRHSWKQWACE
jgi:hypothetical protein